MVLASARIAEEGGNDKQANKVSQWAFEKFNEFLKGEE